MLAQWELVSRLVLAAGLGSVVGWERERLQWAAGLRTHMLVSVGSCLMIIVSAYGYTDPGITTLSVQGLIAIPVAMAAAVGAVFLLKHLPGPWLVSHALNATVLYSHLHEREEQAVGADADWNREGTVAFSPNDGPALIVPVYQEPLEGKTEILWMPKSGEREKEY